MHIFADASSWHLEMSSSNASISLASATIQRCDDILNAQFDRMETDLALSVPFSDEMQATDLLFSSSSITAPKSAVALACSANSQGEVVTQTIPNPRSLPVSVSAAAYSSFVPVNASKAAIAAAQPGLAEHSVAQCHDEDLSGREDEPPVEEEHEDRASHSASAARPAAPAAQPARFLLHAPAAWYDDVPSVADGAVQLTAAAKAKQEDDFIPVVSKRRGARAVSAVASPVAAAHKQARHANKATTRRPQKAPAAQASSLSSKLDACAASLQQRVRQKLILTPGADGAAKQLTAKVARVVDEHTVLVHFTGSFAWVKAVGVVSLQSTSRVVQGADVHVTATDVKRSTAALASVIPDAWFLQCSAVPVLHTRPTTASLPQSSLAAAPAQTKQAAPPAAVAAPALPSNPTTAPALPSIAPSTTTPLPHSAAPSTAAAAPSTDPASKKKRVFNVNAAEFVPGFGGAPLLNTGMQVRMPPFASPAAVAVAQYSAYARHMAHTVMAVSAPVPQGTSPARALAVTVASPVPPATQSLPGQQQPAVRIIQRPSGAQ